MLILNKTQITKNRVQNHSKKKRCKTAQLAKDIGKKYNLAKKKKVYHISILFLCNYVLNHVSIVF